MNGRWRESERAERKKRNEKKRKEAVAFSHVFFHLRIALRIRRRSLLSFWRIFRTFLLFPFAHNSLRWNGIRRGKIKNKRGVWYEEKEKTRQNRQRRRYDWPSLRRLGGSNDPVRCPLDPERRRLLWSCNPSLISSLESPIYCIRSPSFSIRPSLTFFVHVQLQQLLSVICFERFLPKGTQSYTQFLRRRKKNESSCFLLIPFRMSLPWVILGVKRGPHHVPTFLWLLPPFVYFAFSSCQTVLVSSHPPSFLSLIHPHLFVIHELFFSSSLTQEVDVWKENEMAEIENTVYSLPSRWSLFYTRPTQGVRGLSMSFEVSSNVNVASFLPLPHFFDLRSSFNDKDYCTFITREMITPSLDKVREVCMKKKSRPNREKFPSLERIQEGWKMCYKKYSSIHKFLQDTHITRQALEDDSPT